MISRVLLVHGVFILLLARSSVAQPIQVHFESSSDSNTFTTYSPSLGLVLWNGSIGVGGSGGISASNDTEFVHPQNFDLSNTADSASVTVAFKTRTLSPSPPTTRARIASAFLTSRLAGPSSATNDYTLDAQLFRDSDGYWFGVRPDTSVGIGTDIPIHRNLAAFRSTIESLVRALVDGYPHQFVWPDCLRVGNQKSGLERTYAGSNAHFG